MILGANFLKVSDVETGDVIKFLNEGEWTESKKYKYNDGSPKQQLVFQVELGTGEKRTLTMNKINRENLIASWGYDTRNWVNKTAEVFLKESEVAGEVKTVIRLKACEQI